MPHPVTPLPPGSNDVAAWARQRRLGYEARPAEAWAAYIESPPPPTVRIGDKTWDENVTTLAASPSEAEAAFHPRLRKLLSGWGFRGHCEVRPGGLVLYYAGLQPTPNDYDRLLAIIRQVVDKAANPR